MTEYLKKRQERLKKKKIRDNAIFGLFGGLIIVFISLFKWYKDFDSRFLVVHIIFLGIGVFLMLGGLIMPERLDKLYQGFSFIGNKIGECIFEILLSIIYFLLICPAGLLFKRKKESYLYNMWEEDYLGKEDSGFVFRNDYENKNRNGIIGTLLRLIGLFINNGQYIFIPAVIILIVLGIILFFVSSSVMAPFIYTLF